MPQGAAQPHPGLLQEGFQAERLCKGLCWTQGQIRLLTPRRGQRALERLTGRLEGTLRGRAGAQVQVQVGAGSGVSTVSRGQARPGHQATPARLTTAPALLDAAHRACARNLGPFRRTKLQFGLGELVLARASFSSQPFRDVTCLIARHMASHARAPARARAPATRARDARSRFC